MVTPTRTAPPRDGPLVAAAARSGTATRLVPSNIPLGESHELERIYREYFPFVWRSLRRLGAPRESLDDAVQDVFIVALRRAQEFGGRSSYRTWLFGIAANVAREQRRKQRRAAEHDPLDDSAPQALSAATPFDHVESHEALRFVEAFLETLDDARRAVFILAELEQMSSPEIAEALGMKLNTVYSRLRAAREAFSERLKAREVAR